MSGHVSLRPVLKKCGGLLKRHWRRLLIGSGVVFLVVLCGTTLFPQRMEFQFGKPVNCRVSPRFFPGLSRIDHRPPFSITRPASFSIGKIIIYSHRFCATATAAPEARTNHTYNEPLLGSASLGRRLTIAVGNYPSLSAVYSKRIERKMLPPDGTLTLELDQSDTTFSYAAVMNDSSAPCTVKQDAISCDLERLKLAYATKYDIRLVRLFKQKTVGTVASTPVETITPTRITSTSVAAGAVVEQKPIEITIHTDKTLSNVGTVTLIAKKDGTETTIPTQTRLADKSIVVSFGQGIDRKTAFELRVASVTASDGSGFIGKSFVLPFSTSGGPKVSNINIGNRNVALHPSIVLSFDQVLLSGQDLERQLSFVVQGQVRPATLKLNANYVTLVPKDPLPLCTPFSIRIGSGVQNQYGVGGDSAWTFNSRTICYTTFSIGSSIKGRSITAYSFGSGNNPIVYLGAMHGDEANTRTLMNEWFNELNSAPDRLPGRSLVVIPSVNPDGVASGSRFNAAGIDLNRNFPANDWKSMVTTPDSSQPSPAGGPSPLSEPESQAIANYIRQTRPRMVFSFHSAAAVVEANEAGDSVGVAALYAGKARYRAVPKSQSAPIFQYDTTGAMEDWMRDSLGLPAIVVELLSDSSSEFSRNRDALWYSTGL